MADSEMRLRRQMVKAKELRDEALKEIEGLKADNVALASALPWGVMENCQLRLQTFGPRDNLQVLPNQPRPPGW